MKKVFKLFLFLFLISNNLALGDEVKEMDTNYLVHISEEFDDQILQSINRNIQKIIDSAKYIVNFMITLAIIFAGKRLIFGSHDFKEFCKEIIQIILVFGAIWGFLNYLSFPEIISYITSITKLPTGEEYNCIQLIVDQITNIWKMIISYVKSQINIWNIFSYSTVAQHCIFSSVFAIISTFFLLFILANYLIITIQMYFVSSVGILCLALGGVSSTNEFAMNYFKMAIAFALILMTNTFLIMTCDYLLKDLLAKDFFLNPFTFFTNSLLFTIVTFCFAYLTIEVPNSVGKLISPQSTHTMGVKQSFLFVFGWISPLSKNIIKKIKG